MSSMRPKDPGEGIPPSSRSGVSGVRRVALGGSADRVEASRSSFDVRLRVLLVDDDPSVLESMQAILCDEVDVTTALSGERAVELLEAANFHIVCSDYLMPGMDGAELLRRASLVSQSVGCLMITGADEYFQAKMAARHYVLLKPVDPERLLNMILHLGRVIEMKRSVERLGAGTRR